MDTKAFFCGFKKHALEEIEFSQFMSVLAGTFGVYMRDLFGANILFSVGRGGNESFVLNMITPSRVVRIFETNPSDGMMEEDWWVEQAHGLEWDVIDALTRFGEGMSISVSPFMGLWSLQYNGDNDQFYGEFRFWCSDLVYAN